MNYKHKKDNKKINNAKCGNGNRSIPAIILDCDIRSQEGVIQSFGRHDIPVIAVSHKSDCPAFHSKYVMGSIVSPRIDDGFQEYIDFLLSLPSKGVIVYSNDVSSVVLAKHQDKLRESGFLLNLPSSENLLKVFDKFTSPNLSPIRYCAKPPGSARTPTGADWSRH